MPHLCKFQQAWTFFKMRTKMNCWIKCWGARKKYFRDLPQTWNPFVAASDKFWQKENEWTKIFWQKMYQNERFDRNHLESWHFHFKLSERKKPFCQMLHFLWSMSWVWSVWNIFGDRIKKSCGGSVLSGDGWLQGLKHEVLEKPKNCKDLTCSLPIKLKALLYLTGTCWYCLVMTAWFLYRGPNCCW